ncbi:uncharacterized protein LOC106170257 [Lingula anatina]|uniref:Phospholipase A2 n=1 Tax=Lingula anatina TaxID=7574 RepID=A0A1S3IBM9_LINAN|nr:uncharacterized protein LOC106162506 [Lingula anatina]XP_013405506.1 uncharacterized protein LOC106170257 [Lingula anatina]|eukprot:XP_013395266.1 uncharacterized protein LOC106162506 [Lingula anatina]
MAWCFGDSLSLTILCVVVCAATAEISDEIKEFHRHSVLDLGCIDDANKMLSAKLDEVKIDLKSLSAARDENDTTLTYISNPARHRFQDASYALRRCTHKALKVRHRYFGIDRHNYCWGPLSSDVELETAVEQSPQNQPSHCKNDMPRKGQVRLFRVDKGHHPLESVAEFSTLVGCVTGMDPLKYYGYGCHCGLGGHGAVVDPTDECCKIHDECYEMLTRTGQCNWRLTVYLLPYSYSGCKGNNMTPACRLPSWYWLYGRCRYQICKCDMIAAQCFQDQRGTFNAKYVNYDKRKCH